MTAYLHSSKHEPIPRRKSKPKPSTLDRHPAYQELRAAIFNGKMTPQEQVWITLGPKDVELTGYKFPARAAVEHLKRALHSARLDSDFRVFKYETDQKDTWIVKVVYEPPMAGKAPARRQA